MLIDWRHSSISIGLSIMIGRREGLAIIKSNGYSIQVTADWIHF